MTGEHPVRREFSAVPIGLGVSAVVLAAALGFWLGPWSTAIVTVGFALTLIAGMVAWSARAARPRAVDAPHVRPISDRRFRILVVADDRWVSSDSIEELMSHAAGRPVSVFATTPALESRVGRITADQNGYDDATQRLAVTLDALREAGVETDGEVGPDDPLQAADDGLRRFPADEIVFVTHEDRPTNWLEDGVVTLADSRYPQPVRHISVS
jgi:hypothetical protein